MIKGRFHQQGSAAFVKAALLVIGDHFQLKDDSSLIKQGNLTEISVSDRLGNIQRKLTFADGSMFSSTENDAIDTIFAQTKSANGFIHKLESNFSFVLIALVVTIALSYSFIKWGIPSISATIAEALPQKTNDIIGSHTLSFLDDYIFDESQLSQERQDEIRNHFKKNIETSYQSHEKIIFTLYFRDWSDGGIGIPNALALPSGEIVLTDKFVELSQNQDEIDAVLLHEIGHIAHRHSLKMVIQSTLVTTVIMVVTGDVNAVADMGIGLGSVLLSANYSRDYESEADDFAFKKMLEIGIDPISFATIMNRITDYSRESFAPKKEKEKTTEKRMTDYFSTHPTTKQRVEQAEQYSKCFKAGFKTCPQAL